jgi:hypothetical protein
MAPVRIGSGRHRWGTWIVFRRWRRSSARWTLDRFRLRELHCRSAVEPVIGHLKAEHSMGRNYLGSVAATPSTPSPATTSAASSDGSGLCCAKSSALSSPSCDQAELRLLGGRTYEEVPDLKLKWIGGRGPPANLLSRTPPCIVHKYLPAYHARRPLARGLSTSGIAKLLSAIPIPETIVSGPDRLMS